MLLRDDELKGVPVETESGERIGRLAGFVLDPETGMVAQFRVRPRGVAALLAPARSELLIAHAQVVSLTAERMVVRGGGTAVGQRHRRTFAPAESPQPAMSQPLSTSTAPPEHP